MDTKQDNTVPEGEISAKELIVKIQMWLRFLVSRWLFISLFVVIGAGLAIFLNLRKKAIYSAECIFTLDENKGPATPSSAGLALLGLGGVNADGGLFKGKNLIWLYSSREMLAASLFAPLDSTSEKKLFIDWFLEIDEEGRKVRKNNKAHFVAHEDSKTLNREQNALLGFVMGRIRAKYLTVTETKNTDNFISVTIKSTDENFAKAFSDVLVKTVNDYYVSTKTQKLRNEIAILQRKTDNYQGEMNTAMYQTAEAVDATPYPNPNQQVLQVPSQKKGVGVRVNSELYVEMVRALESNKMNLAKETPLIQVIEEPIFPLPMAKTPVYFAAIVGAILAFILAVAILTVTRIYRSVMEAA